MLITLFSGPRWWLGWAGPGRDRMGWLVDLPLPGAADGLPLWQEGQEGGGRKGGRGQGNWSKNSCCVCELRQVPPKVQGRWPSLVTGRCLRLEGRRNQKDFSLIRPLGRFIL